MLNHIILR